MAFFLIVFGPAAQSLRPGVSMKMLNCGRARFDRLSWVGIGLLLVTGIVNLALRAPTIPSGLFYFTILGVKLLFFMAMLINQALQALTNEVEDSAEVWPEPLHVFWSKWFMLLKVNATLGPIATLFGLALATYY